MSPLTKYDQACTLSELNALEFFSSIFAFFILHATGAGVRVRGTLYVIMDVAGFPNHIVIYIFYNSFALRLHLSIFTAWLYFVPHFIYWSLMYSIIYYYLMKVSNQS